MSRPLPKEITSYDLLKAAAIIFMFLDHAGYYFYPDEAWFRVLGRFSAPIWFYLIGYAETRYVQKGLWIGAGVVTATWLVSGQYLFPLNVLFSLAFCRLLIDQIMLRATKNHESFWGMFLLLFFLSLPGLIAVEYGTLGVMFAMFGFLRRHRGAFFIRLSAQRAFMAAAGFCYACVMLMLLPPLDGNQLLTLFAGTGVLCVILYVFAPRTFPRLTRLCGPVAPLIRFMGRRTLEIYVIHLVLLAGVVMALYPARFGLFEFEFAPPSLAGLFN